MQYPGERVFQANLGFGRTELGHPHHSVAFNPFPSPVTLGIFAAGDLLAACRHCYPAPNLDPVRHTRREDGVSKNQGTRHYTAHVASSLLLLFFFCPPQFLWSFLSFVFPFLVNSPYFPQPTSLQLQASPLKSRPALVGLPKPQGTFRNLEQPLLRTPHHVAFHATFHAALPI